jgi:hypothetical protein
MGRIAPKAIRAFKEKTQGAKGPSSNPLCSTAITETIAGETSQETEGAS